MSREVSSIGCKGFEFQVDICLQCNMELLGFRVYKLVVGLSGLAQP